MWQHWKEVSSAGRGVKADYRLDGGELGRGGQALVLRGIHKETGVPIAFKRLLPGLVGSPEARARLRREIDVGSRLRHRYAVPVLDADTASRWFVMPLADEALDGRRDELAQNDERLHVLVRQVAEGLTAAHALNWTHRDVKPANILRYSNQGKYRWAVADWGLGRGPVGHTSVPGRTKVGVAYGTEGFAAPELSADAHGASAAADVFSLGQVIGWVLTGQSPRAHIPLLPASPPWRYVVQAATRLNPKDRPQSMRELLDLVDAELAPLPQAPSAIAEDLLQKALGGNLDEGIQLLRMAEANPTDFSLFVDGVSQLGSDTIELAADRHGGTLMSVLDALKNLDPESSFTPFSQIVRLETFAARVFAVAAGRQDSMVAAAALEAFCAWDDEWDRWDSQRVLRSALLRAKGVVAQEAAHVLRRHPETASHLAELADDRRLDTGIRGVLYQSGD